MSWIYYVMIGLAAYLLGSFPTAYVVVKKFAGKDIREYGSGNVGTMNVHRATENKLLTLAVLLGDLLKGFLAVLLVQQFFPSNQTALFLAGILVLLGHNYSLFLKFKGGRGLATGAGVMLAHQPMVVLFWVIIWVPVFLISQILVAGTLVTTVLTPLVTYYFYGKGVTFYLILTICLIVLVRHPDKIKKLIEGTEPKRYWKVRDTKNV